MEDNLICLVKAAQGGQPGAFAALAEALRPNIFQLTSRFARTAPDFDDLSQEICLQLWKSLPKLRECGAFPGWFKSLSVRTCYQWLRRRRNRQEREVPLEHLPESAADQTPPDDDGEKAAAIIHAALAKLKPPERLVLTLLELEGHTIRDIAAFTGWSEGNVKVRAHRARAALKRTLVEDGYVSLRLAAPMD